VSYYDIRAAQNAMRALHGKPLGLMKLDVQFSIPKVNVMRYFIFVPFMLHAGYAILFFTLATKSLELFLCVSYLTCESNLLVCKSLFNDVACHMC
jgi:hypothetical protein